MKKVLVISYYWPPSGGSGVQRWVKMCKYLPGFGWSPIVYTPLNPALLSTDESLCAEVADVEVLRRPILEPGQFAKRTTSAQVTPINGGKKTLKQRIAMWIRGNCFIPDPRVLWVGPSYRWLKKYLREHPVDAIVSTGPPHSMHLLARRLHASTGIPWVADFRDPWTKMFYFKHLQLSSWARRLHERLEKKVLDSCNCVVAVSPLVRDDFAAMTSTPVHLITNGFDTADFPETAVKGKADGGNDAGGSFTLLHAGLFASDGNPEALWKAIAGLCAEDSDFASRLRIVLCGKTDRQILDSIKSAGLEKYTQDLGYQMHTEVVKLMRSATVLMLPLRKEPEYRATLPGKLFEYLASRRPVIGIGQRDGAMAAVLKETGAGSTFEWDDAEGMKAFLAGCFVRHCAGKLADNSADLSKYTRQSLAERYARLLDAITAPRGVSSIKPCHPRHGKRGDRLRWGPKRSEDVWGRHTPRGSQKPKQ